MKKILTAALLALLFVLPSFAQETAEKSKPIWDHGDNVSDLTYRNVTIYRVLDQKDSYVVIYAKRGIGIGQAVIPKKWFKESPRKLAFRTKPASLNPYMTVISKNGEFYQVWLTVPVSRNDSTWGVLDTGTEVAGTDADTLSIEY